MDSEWHTTPAKLNYHLTAGLYIQAPISAASLSLPSCSPPSCFPSFSIDSSPYPTPIPGAPAPPTCSCQSSSVLSRMAVMLQPRTHLSAPRVPVLPAPRPHACVSHHLCRRRTAVMPQHLTHLVHLLCLSRPHSTHMLQAVTICAEQRHLTHLGAPLVPVLPTRRPAPQRHPLACIGHHACP